MHFSSDSESYFLTLKTFLKFKAREFLRQITSYVLKQGYNEAHHIVCKRVEGTFFTERSLKNSYCSAYSCSNAWAKELPHRILSIKEKNLL